MIKYALICGLDHEFDAWFSSSEDFDRQQQAGQVTCPWCEDTHVRKQIMAPSVKGGRGRGHETGPHFANFAKQVREQIAKSHEYVGDDFADRARAMHDGREDEAPIYGQVSPGEAKALADEGVPALPLPDAFVPAREKKTN